MDEFLAFMAQNGMENAPELTVFVKRFLDDPALIYTMEPEQIARMEDHMDTAIALLIHAANKGEDCRMAA